jgi:hypothetical protein
VLLEIVEGLSEQLNVVAELAEAAIAVEAEDPPHGSGAMIVIDVLGFVLVADRADATLLKLQPLDLHRIHAIASLQMERSGTPVVLHAILTRDSIVARLAIRHPTGPAGAVARKLVDGFELAACRTAHLIRHGSSPSI